MQTRLTKLAIWLSTLALLAAAACKKDDKGGDTDQGGDTAKTGDGDGDTAKPPEPEPAKMVENPLPQTGLVITLPEGATIAEAIVAGADEVTFPGVQSKMIVKPRLVTDKELDAHMEWAKGHQIQKFQKEIVKEGSGKTYTYMHAVDMGGQPKVVYMQMFQIGDKDFACFSNADNEDAARAMMAACATVKAGDGAAAGDGDEGDEGDEGDGDEDEGAAAPKKPAPKKKAKAKKAKDDGGW